MPQWNCGCPNCVAVRAGDRRILPRTQDSLAVTADGAAWALFNASPDVAGQIEGCADLHPRGRRHSPIAAIVLTNGDVDHCVGLFSLRESSPLVVYATETVWRGLAHENALFRTLQRYPGHTTFRPLTLGASHALADADGRPLGLTVAVHGAAGKRPIHLDGTGAPSAEDNVALFVRQGDGPTLAYAPGCAAVGDLAGPLAAADVVLFDGTFWSEDELAERGVGQARARDMAHLPVGGAAGSLARLSALPGFCPRRRIYTHVNNTNPMLVEGSPERRAVEASGWEVAYDGLELTL